MIQSDENMDSQQTPRPPVDFAAAQNAASVKPAIQQQQQQQAPFAVTNNNGPLDGPPRFPQPQQFPGPGAAPGPRPGYGPAVGQRAPVPRPPFFGRPPQPGQGPPRFPPPRPPPAGYGPGPQGFPLGRPPFPPIGVDPRFLRPQHPPPPHQQQQQHQAVLRRQSSLADGRMAEAEQASRAASALEPAADQQSKDKLAKTKAEADLEQQSAQPAKQPSPDKEDEQRALNDEAERQPLERPASRMSHSAAPALAEAPQQDAPTASGSRATSAAPTIAEGLDNPTAPGGARAVQSAGPAPSELASSQDRIPSAPPKTPSSERSSIKGFDEGRRKSLSTPVASPTQLDPPAQPAIVLDDLATSASPHPNRATPVAAATTASADQSQRAAAPPRAQAASKEPGLVKKSPSARSIKQDAENDSGVDESTQRREAPKSNGVSSRTPSKTRDADKRSAAGSPVKSPNKSIKSLPRTPDAAPPTAEKKKVPMNKVQVGAAPSPNLKSVRSKIGSLENATHKPGGGKIKIENRKLDFSSAQPKIAAKNDKYTPSGGDKKIEQVKLQWNAKPKIGSLDNATYKPGGGNKKIESVKLDFKDKAKSKVGSKENAKYVPGGGSIKSSATSPKTPQDNNVNIESQKVEFKAESKVGSMDNMKHRPGGGDKKIFDDKSYLRQTSSNVGSVSGSGSQVAPRRPNSLVGLSPSDKRSSFDSPQPPPSTPTRSRNPISPSAAITPGSVRTSFDKTPETPTAGKKSLPGSPRKNKSTKELLLPKLSPSNTDYPATSETHKKKQTKVTLPNLQK